MSEEPARISAFDEFLDRLLRGDDLDVEEFLRSNPGLPDDEQAQLRRLCTRPGTAEALPRPSDTGQLERRLQPASVLPSGDTRPVGIAPIERIGAWRLGRRIGAGAMGVVFLAQDEDLGREVAIKILGPDLLGTGERSDRFLREVRSAARLRHPNIVTVHAAGEEGGFRYMVMEYVPGSGLQDVMADHAMQGSRTPVADALRWGIEIARALQSAHDGGVLHRDVKPSNIRITPDGRAVLLDFGLAREAGDATLTETGAFRGSPQYASPEQVDPGTTPIDARTDVYSLGATLYEMLAGVAPFRGETRENLFHNILAREPIPLRRLDPSIPRDLETVVMAALSKEPAGRPKSAAAFADDLEAVREGRPVSIRPPSALGRMSRWARRHPARAGLIAAVAIAIAAVGVLFGFIYANEDKIKQAEAANRDAALARMLEEGFLDVSEDGDPASQAVFEKAMRFAPESQEAIAGFALARLSQRDAAGVVTFLDRLPEATRSTMWAGRIRIAALRELKRVDEAKEVAKALDKPATPLDEFVTGFISLQEAHLSTLAVKTDFLGPAIDHLRQAIMLSRHAVPFYYYELGHALWHAKRNDEARQVAQAIAGVAAESPERWFAIGRTLREADHAGAARALEQAMHPPPQNLSRKHFCVLGLSEIGDEDQRRHALEFAREILQSDPSNRFSQYVVGTTALVNHDVELGLASFRKALGLLPTEGTAMGFTPNHYLNMARAFESHSDPEGAILVFRNLVRVAPQNPHWWNALGVRLLHRGDLDEAIQCFEKAVKLEPDDAEALCNLGRTLQKRGQLERGLEILSRGHGIGSTRPNWKYPSAKWVADAEERVDLQKKLEDFRKGEGPTPAPDFLLGFATKVCRPKKLFAEAAKLYAKAFAADPAFLSETEQDWVLEAASTALLAGIGEGGDAPAASEARGALRDQSRTWLLSGLATAEEEGSEDGPSAGLAFARIRAWMKDRTLARTRAPPELAELTPEEAAAWRALWKRCEAFVAKRPESASSRVTK